MTTRTKYARQLQLAKRLDRLRARRLDLEAKLTDTIAAETEILDALHRSEGVSQKDLAEFLALSRTAVGPRLADYWARQGIDWHPPYGRHDNRLRLTRDGRGEPVVWSALDSLEA